MSGKPMPTPAPEQKTADHPAFLSGGGEMGAMMRACDWSRTPLGPPEAWPQSLRTAVGLMLGAKQPVYIAWGPDLISLYNDSYLPIVGAKHPGLGKPFAELWAEIWHEFRPIVEATLAGEAQYFVDLPIALAGRPGLPVSYFIFSYTALRDDAGKVAGFYCVATETTGQVLAERRQAFRLALEERLRGLSDPKDIMAAASEELGRWLGAGLVAYAEVDASGEWAVIERDWNDGTIPSVVGRYSLEDFGVTDLRRGETIVIDDVRSDPRTSSPAALRSYGRLSVAAFLYVPLVKAGRLVAVLSVNSGTPRRWTPADVALAGDVAERTWGAVERVRAETAERRRAGQLQALAAASLAITQAPTLAAKLDAVTCAAREIVGAHQGVTSLTCGADWSQAVTSTILSGKYGRWRDYGTVPDGSGIYAWLCEQNRPVRMTQAELEAHPRWRGFGSHAADHPPMRGWLAAPLVAEDGRNLGLIQLSDKEDGSEFDESDEAIIVQLAQLASAAVVRAQAEEALAAKEAQLRTILETVPVGIVLAELPSGRIVEGNGYVEQMLRHPVLPSPNINSYDEWESYHADGSRVSGHEYPLARMVLHAEEAPEVEVHYQRGDGTRAWVRIMGRPVRNEAGELVGGVVAIVDVDAERRAQEALLRAAEEFRTLADNISQFAWMANADGWIYWYNKRWFDFTGSTLEEMQGWGWQKVHHPEHVERMVRTISHAFAAGKPWEATFPLRGKDGRYRWFLTRALPIRNEAGEIVRWFGTNTDVDDLKRAQDEVERTSTLLRLIGDSTPDLIYAKDRESRILYANAAVRKVIGRPAEEILGHSDLEWASDRRQAELMVKNDRRVMDTGEILDVDEVFTGPDGVTAYYRSVKAPLRNADGEVIGLVGVTSDVTARRAAEEALARLNADLERQVQERTAQLVQSQKMEVIGRLTGGVAHDFNNVLQGIGSCLHVLRDHVPAGAASRLYEAALQSIERGGRLTQSLLAFARRQTLAPKPTDVHGLLEGMRPLLERTLGGLIRFDIAVAPGTTVAQIDPAQLESAVLNLAINARDAMPAGGSLTLRVDAVSVAGPDEPGRPAGLAPGDYVRVSAQDTGVGMDAATLTRVFEPFFTTKGVNGSGLGLSMVHGMAAQSGGGVHIASTPGKGTVVTLYLPRAQPSGAEAARSRAAKNGTGQAILLVDDDAIVRMGIKALMEDLGYQVIDAASGEEALEILHAGTTVDALVTDYAMPGMNGGAVVQQARRLAPALPVMVITGYADVPGFADDVAVLHKPFSPKELEVGVAAILRGTRQADVVCH